MAEFDVTVDAEQVRRKLKQVQADMQGPAMIAGMRRAITPVMRSAKGNAPVDTGRLASSIHADVVKAGGDVVIGVVGSNVKYGPFMEHGTQPHFPPLSALEVWARRHGTTAWLVCSAIARRGLKARRFLRRALSDNEDRVLQTLKRTVERIVRM